MSKSSIEWTDETWNPVVGCKEISPGCANCYAVPMSYRKELMDADKFINTYTGLTTLNLNKKKRHFVGEVRVLPERLGTPLHWKKPRNVFVNSMGDLFHEGVPFEFIAAVFGVMAACPHHTFQVLTKRHDRMREFFEWVRARAGGLERARWFCRHALLPFGITLAPPKYESALQWPLPNVWLGVSAENQACFDARVSMLLETPAAVRFLSLEPLLERLELSERIAFFNVNDWSPAPSEIHWVIVGGESGPNARECRVEWIAYIVAQCKAAGVPCFVKQLGSHATIGGKRLKLSGKGGDRAEWPAACQEWPREWPRKVV